ncbi:FHA domain-containing protein [Winogradskyella tangerina]|uniref:FHA domain-containing protein n=1 Tax=Winogradskyella tangerina TaxID=2023240 RepID=UPI000DBE89EE|nr:FHA domain-containing protein [Winogradskyella tangerina]
MHHTCENCGTRVLIPEEWVILGINKRIKCKVCKTRYFFNLERNLSSQKDTKRSKKSGTVLIEDNDFAQHSFKIKISNETDDKMLGMKNLYPGKIYIIGRDAARIRSYNSQADPIIINAAMDSAVSRIHAMLTIDKGIIIEDLKSLNGTYIINNHTTEKLKENDRVILKMDDKIKIGKQTIISIE